LAFGFTLLAFIPFHQAESKLFIELFEMIISYCVETLYPNPI
jgi:hypothetical protein